MAEKSTKPKTIKEAMDELRDFWKAPTGEDVLSGINSKDLLSKDAPETSTCFEDGLGNSWWKKEEHQPFIAELNGFDWDCPKCRKSWERQPKEDELEPIPAHAFFGDATKAKIVILGINPQFDSVRDMDEQKLVDYNTFLPWAHPKAHDKKNDEDDGWDWHRALWLNLQEWTGWRSSQCAKLFQLEGFPYATHGKGHIPKKYRDGKYLLPSQVLAAALLSALLRDVVKNNRKLVFITTNPVLEFWINAFDKIGCDSDEKEALKRRTLIAKNGLVKNSSLGNLCILESYRRNKKLSDTERENQLSEVRDLLRDQGILNDKANC